VLTKLKKYNGKTKRKPLNSLESNGYRGLLLEGIVEKVGFLSLERKIVGVTDGDSGDDGRDKFS